MGEEDWTAESRFAYPTLAIFDAWEIAANEGARIQRPSETLDQARKEMGAPSSSAFGSSSLGRYYRKEV